MSISNCGFPKACYHVLGGKNSVSGPGKKERVAIVKIL